MDVKDPEDRSVSIVPLRFWTDHRDRDGQLVEVERVEWCRKGNSGATTIMTLREVKATPDIWAALQPYYEHWKQGLGDPIDGTPLDAWPACTAGIASKLRSLHLRSVEDVAEADESTLNRIGLGARDLKRKAAAFVANKDANATAGEIAKLERENGELRGRLGELEEQIAELVAASKVEPEVKPRGRGRPRKAA